MARSCLPAIVFCCGIAMAAQGPAAEPDDDDASGLDFGGQVELAFEREQNFDLDRAEDDDLSLLGAELQLELVWRPNPYLATNLLLSARQEYALPDVGGDDLRAPELLVEEAYLTLTAPALASSLYLGRQPFEDGRQWWYDADLDAVRAILRRSGLTLEASASREALVQQDLLQQNREDAIDNYILHAAYQVAESVMLGAYGIISDHREGSPDRPVFLGLQSSGRLLERLDFWVDAALVRGAAEERDLAGLGIDLLAAWQLDLPLAPRLILGYAFGSGDADSADDQDDAFRQTGLQGNEAAIGGLVPLHYYGELLDPELSNLAILTAGIGATPLDNLSLDLLFHHYRQDEASAEARDWALDAEPSGEHRRLGSELDLVLGFLPLEDLQLSAFLGWFMPGRAFADDPDDALFVRLEAQYEF